MEILGTIVVVSERLPIFSHIRITMEVENTDFISWQYPKWMKVPVEPLEGADGPGEKAFTDENTTVRALHLTY